MSIRALELYCGIGGFAEAMEGRGVEVVAALDASQHVIATYNINHRPVGKQRNLLQMKLRDFEAYEADLWWMSPPCAPYTRRGKQLDLKDHRTVSYLLVVDAIRQLRPRFVAMENVEGFADSEAREALLTALEGYRVVDRVLCPTEIGVPNKRPRFYLTAERDAEPGVHRAPDPTPRRLADWRDYLSPEPSHDVVPPEILERYGRGFHVMTDDEPYTTCFTGSYGKSWNYTGSYLPVGDEIRRFTPREVLDFLGFRKDFEFPHEFDVRQRYKYIGNSLSVPAVRHVMSELVD